MNIKLGPHMDSTLKSKKHKKSTSRIVCLFGCSLKTGNRGVSALTASLVKLIVGVLPEARLHLMIGSKSPENQSLVVTNRQIDLTVVNYRGSLRSGFQKNIFFIFLLAFTYRIFPVLAVRKKILSKNRWLRVLHEADFIGDIRGGDSFSDIYGLRRFVLGSLPRIATLLIGQKIVLLPQTYGPYKWWFSRVMARFILRRSSYIMSRDQQSISIVRELVGEKDGDRHVLFCPDVAFVLDPVVPERIVLNTRLDLEEIKRSGTNIIVGLNVNGLMYNGGYTGKNMFNLRLDYHKFLVFCIERFIDIQNVCVLLVPHTFGVPGNVNSDPDACVKVISSLSTTKRHAVYMLEGEYDQNEIKGIIGCCDFFIGSRMHSCIASLSQGVPTVGVAYSKKFVGVFNSVGFGDMVIDARTSSLEEAVKNIFMSFHDRDIRSDELVVRVMSIQEQLWSIFDKILTI